MKIGQEDLPSYMSFTFSFTGMRLQGSTLVPVDWDVEVELIGDNESFSAEDHTIAFQRMTYWTELALSDIIILDPENYDSVIATETENLTLWLPGAASDDTLAQALHSKLQTIAGPAIILGEITIDPSDTPTKYFFSPIKKGQYNINRENKKNTDLKVYHAEPWYCRRDSLTYELIIDDVQTKKSYDELLSEYQDPLDMLDTQLADQLDFEVTDGGSEAEIFQVGTTNSDSKE